MYNIYNIEHSNMLNNIMRRHLELQPWQARGSTSRALNDKTAAKSTNYHVPHHLANQANLALYIIIFTGVNISPKKIENCLSWILGLLKLSVVVSIGFFLKLSIRFYSHFPTMEISIINLKPLKMVITG